MSLTERPLAIVCVMLLLLSFSMNYVIPDCTNKLGLVVVSTMITDSQIWNLITSQFYEMSPIKLLFDIVGILVVTKSTKIIGGFDQFGLFCIVSVLSCSIFTSVYCFIRFFLTGIEAMIMDPIYGFAGVFMMMLTYGRQQFQSKAIFEQVPWITYNNLPVLVLSSQIFLWLVGLKVLAIDIPFSLIAMLVSWSYLRFYYKFDDSVNVLGDRSEGFAFIAMFPEALYLIVIPLSTAFYNVFALCGIFPELEVQAEKPKLSHHLRYDTELEAAPVAPIRNCDVVQDRRRAKALKLLDAKMAQLNEGEGDGWNDKGEDDLEMSVNSVEKSTVRI